VSAFEQLARERRRPLRRASEGRGKLSRDPLLVPSAQLVVICAALLDFFRGWKLSGKARFRAWRKTNIDGGGLHSTWFPLILPPVFPTHLDGAVQPNRMLELSYRNENPGYTTPSRVTPLSGA